MRGKRYSVSWTGLLLLVMFSLACGLFTGTPTATKEPPSPATPPPPQKRQQIPFRTVVQITAMVDDNGTLIEGWSGSGTIISPDGLILTNAHVVLSDKYYHVEKLVVALTEAEDQPPRPTYYAEVMQADPNLDIAVIRITSDLDGNPVDRASLNLPFARLGDADELRLGDPLIILGYPGIGGQTITLTRGEVSGFTAEEPYGNRAFIKTSATIAGGNSGGLAANARGELIGVPTQLGYGGDDQYVDCRTLADTNRDGVVDENDACVPTGGFINALRPVNLALPLIEAAKRGEVAVVEEPQPDSTSSSTEFPQIGEAIYSQDFSSPSGTWADDTLEGGALFNQDGRFHIRVDETRYLIWNYADLDEGDVILEVSARIENPTGEGDFGLLCRYRDSDNFYALEVSEDGYFSIWMQENGEFRSLLDWTPLPSSAPEGDVTLRAACVGDRLILALGD
ncbi:MAG: serine protease, partial [Anaerolineae bacterium]